MKKRWIALFSLFFLGYIACDDTSPAPPDHSMDFEVLVFTDIHVNCWECNQFENVQNLFNKLNNREYSEVPFITITGDLVNCNGSSDVNDYYENAADIDPSKRNLQANAYKHLRDQLQLPVYESLGNHDYNLCSGPHESYDTVLEMEAVWKKLRGLDPYYSVEHNGFRFIFLACNRGDYYQDYNYAAFDEEQMNWLEAELQKGDPSLFFMHYPPITDNPVVMNPTHPTEQRIVEEDRFYDLVQQYQDLIKGMFVGHMHYWARDFLYETIPVYLTGGTEVIDNPMGMLGDDDFTNNYHLISLDTVDFTIEVTKGDPSAPYLDGGGFE